MIEHNNRVSNVTDQNVRVLLVEDDETNRFVTEAKLSKRGFTVHVAENGKEACERLTCEAYDVILMDVSMPIMDGFEATQHIRSSPNSFSTIPIIGLTAHGHEEVRVRCRDAGMNDFLCKPAHGDDICSAIQNCLEY